MVRANRQHFREFLFNHLPIQWGKEFKHYEEDRDGITVFFADGTSARGTVLVGADGAHSRIRKQLLGSQASALVLSSYVCVIQEVSLTREQYAPLHEIGSAAVIATKTDVRYLVGMLDTYEGSETAKFYSATCWKPDNVEKTNEWIAHASKKELFQTILDKVEGIPEVLTKLIHIGGEAGMVDHQIKFTEFVSPDYLPRGRVTLLGDAAHTMVPFRGAGANTALNDACLFAKTLIKEIRESKEVNTDWLLQTYDKTMLPRGRDTVLASRAAGEDFLDTVRARLTFGEH